jgi:hypothetical protein
MTITVTHSTVADASFSATGAAAWDATHSFTGILDVANGGTGTATPSLVAGTNVTVTGTWPNQTIAASGGGGSGTVTSVSVVSANGFAGTVANATTTPAVTISTSITGVLKGNGTAISAASAGTDYQAPITLTTTGTSGAATFVSNTLNIPQYSSGGGSGTVTSVDATVPTFLSVTGGPITTSGTLAISYSGTALPLANGGTGQTTRQAAINALVSTLTNRFFLRGNGTNVTMALIQVPDVPILNQDTTGTAANVTGTSNSTLTTLSALSLPGSQVSGDISGNSANVTGTVAVANGGTGTATPNLVAGENITLSGSWPNQTVNSTYTGFKNRFINGQMQIAQRATSGTSGNAVPTTTPTYPSVDRWYAYATGATVTVAQVAGSGAIKNNLQATGAASVTAVGIGQRIEQLNCYDMAGSTATLSVNISNSLLTTVTWTANYATSADTWSAKTQIATGTFTVTSTLTNYSAQISIPAAATTGIEILFTVGAQTSGTWVIGNVQLEKGGLATSFDYRAYGAEFHLCQRYYYSIGGSQVNEMANVGSFQAYSGTQAAGNLIFPITMRAPPTFTSSTVGNWAITTSTYVATSCTAINVAQIGTKGCQIIGTVGSSVLSAGNATNMQASGTLNARLNFNAEL